MLFDSVIGSLKFSNNRVWSFELPALEPLESRLLLTSYVVDTTVDESDGDYSAGDLSLREAIELANTDAAKDTITFSTVAFSGGGTIALEHGQIAISEDLIIQGNGSDIVVDAGFESRIFDVQGTEGIRLAISDLGLVNGYTSENGGAVYLEDVAARFERVQIRDNQSDEMGGGIMGLDSNIVLMNSEITGNNAGTIGGGIGGDYVTVLIKDSLVSGNESGENGGGVGTACCYSSIVVDGATVSYNVAGGNGGAVGGYAADILLSHSTIHGNTSERYGGGIYFVNEASYIITGSTISDNTARDHGGGVYLRDAPIQIVNSTLSGNRTLASGGGAYLALFRYEIVLINSTVTGNEAGKGGGVYIYRHRYIRESAAIDLHNSIVAGNEAFVDASNDVFDTVDSGKHNIIGDAGSSGGMLHGINGNIVGVTASEILNPVLTDIGGQTRVHFLLEGSAAIDHGGNALAVNYGIYGDQLGQDRFAGGTTDIGAFELNDSYSGIQPRISSLDVIENAPNGTLVGVVDVVFPEPGRTYQYDLIDDGGGAFDLNLSTGDLIVEDQELIDYETAPAFTILIRVSDDLGRSAFREFTILVQDILEVPPNLMITSDVIGTYSQDDERVGTVYVDHDDIRISYTFTLLDDANGLFRLEYSSLYINDSSLIGRHGDIHSITVRVESDGLLRDETFLISVSRGVAPTDLWLTDDNVDEPIRGETHRDSIFVRVTDPDPSPPDSHSFRLLDDAEGRFIITSGGFLRPTDLVDYEVATSHEIVVEVADAGGHTYSERFIVHINDVTEDPVDISLEISRLDEDVLDGTEVTRVIVSDMDVIDYTFNLLDDDDGTWGIDSDSGRLTVLDSSSIDYEVSTVSYILVRVEDSGGWAQTERLKFSINNVNEAPTGLFLLGSEVGESENNGSIVGTAGVVDADADWFDSHLFSLVNDAAGRFTIDSNSGQVSVANASLINYTNTASHEIRIKVTDAANNELEEDFVIDVIPDGPTDLTLSASEIFESSPDGMPVGVLTAFNADGLYARPHTFSLINDAGGRFELANQTGELSVLNSELLDYERGIRHQITVQVVAENGRTYSESFFISLVDINEAPTGITLNPSSIGEDALDGALVGTLSAIDEDFSDSHQFLLLDDAGGRFVIDGEGAISVLNGSLLDFEDQSTHTVMVRAIDRGGFDIAREINISILDVNEAPSDLEINNTVIASWQAPGTTVGVVVAVDPDVGDTFSYAIIRDDGNLFSINETTGIISIQNPIGEIDSTFIDVRVTDQLGEILDKRFEFTVIEQASGEISSVNLPARSIQGVAFKGSIKAKVSNDSGLDWSDLRNLDLKLVARPLSGKADQVISMRDYRGRLNHGKTKTVSFAFTTSLPAGNYQILVLASYESPGDFEAVNLTVAEDKSGNPQLLSVDSGAHTDLTTETELGSKLPASHPEGERLKVKLKVHVKNGGNVEMPAAVTSLHVFLEDSLGARHGPPLFVNPNLKLSKMKPGQVKAVNVSFDMPADTALGDFHFAVDIDGLNLIDETNEAGTAESNNSSVTSETILIEESYLDLTTEMGDRKGVRTYSAGKAIKDSRSLRVGNQGNVPTAKSALANLRIEIYDALDQLVATQLIENVKLGNLKPGKSKNVAARMSFDSLAVGDYRTVYTLEPVSFTDTDLSDNTFEQVFRVR